MQDNNESNDVYGTAQYIFFKRDILRESQMLTRRRVCDRRINEDMALVELHSQGEVRRTCRMKTLSQCHSVHNHPLRTGLGLSLGLHGERPETARQRYCTDGSMSRKPPPYKAEVKNRWSYASISLIELLDVNSDKFTLRYQIRALESRTSTYVAEHSPSGSPVDLLTNTLLPFYGAAALWLHLDELWAT